MEVSEGRKLITKDLARAENDKGDFDDSNNDRRLLAKDEAAIGVPKHLDRVDSETLSPLLSASDGKEFRSRWQNIQTGFVDEPRRAVEQADALVAEIMQQLAQSFSDQRSRLESEREHSEKVSTEELRLALRSYRSFFDRLLSV